MGYNQPYFSITPIVVGPDQNTQYRTIQQGITAAVSAGASNAVPKNIFIKPGTYTETLTLAPGIRLIGLGPNGEQAQGANFLPSVTWTGVATSTGTSNVTFQNIRILNTSAVTVFTTATTDKYEFSNCLFSNAGASTIVFGSVNSYSATFNNCSILASNKIISHTTTGTASHSYYDCYNNGDYTATGSAGISLTYFGGTYTGGTNGISLVTGTLSWTSRNFFGSNFKAIGSGSTSSLNFTANNSQFTSPNGAKLFNLGRILSFGGINNYLSSDTGILDNSASNFGGSFTLKNYTLNGLLGSFGDNTDLVLSSCNTVNMTAPTLAAAANIYYNCCATKGDGSSTLGTGFVVTSKELATTAVDGFLYLPTCAGTPTGVPHAYGVSLPIIYDSTNSILYKYEAAAWSALTGAAATVYPLRIINTMTATADPITDCYFSVDAASFPITIELPAAPAAGKYYIIKDTSGIAGTNNITITTAGAVGTFDGLYPLVMNSNFMAVTVVYDGFSRYEVL